MSPHRPYDAIVLGVGAVGSAALRALARRGRRVLGIERFAPGHDRGSSHGQSRMIRQAYFEHPDYVPLVLEAYRQWRDLERASGTSLLSITGLLQVGPPEGPVLRGVAASAARWGLGTEVYEAAQIERRWPGFRVPDGCAGVFEPAAGVLRVEACVRAMAASAEAFGAELWTGTTVAGWKADGNRITVETSRGRVRAARLVVTAGAWSSQLLSDVGVPLVVRRKPQYWFAADERYLAASGCPAYLFELPEGVFYGFPRLDGPTLKAAEHSGGALVDDPAAVDRALDPADLGPVADFVRRCLPGVSPEALDHSVCMYTMSPDEHFLVDRHPMCSQVVFAAGLSGHGFKFAPVLGEVLAQLACDETVTLPMNFLGLRRGSLPAPTEAD